MAYEPQTVTSSSTSTAGNVPQFTDASGTVIKDSGLPVAQILRNATAITAGHLAVWDTDNELKDNGAGITFPQTGQIYQSDGATINRLADRVFVGDAVVNDGNYNTTGEDWLQNLIAGTTSIAQLASLAPIGNIGILGATRSSTAPSTILDNFAVAAFGINDNVSGQKNTVTTLYKETRHYASAFQSIGEESDMVVLTGAPVGYIDPYKMYEQLVTANLWLSCGRPDVSSGNATVALGIINNAGTGIPASGQYTKGIVFDANAIYGTSASSPGASCAIAFAAGHQIQWFNSSSQVTSGISCVATQEGAVSLEFADTIGAVFSQGLAGPYLFRVSPVANAVNYIATSGSATGAPCVVEAYGSDTNVDLLIAGKGAGRVMFGTTALGATTPTSFSATHILVIKDASGSEYYVPMATAPW